VKRTGILNPELAAVVAELGHGDTLVIADAGLRLPPGARVVHLELVAGIPNVSEVLSAVLAELVVEEALVATEFEEWNPDVFDSVRSLLPVPPRTLPHEELAIQLAGRAKAYVKTGECSAYSSVALVAGVSYFAAAVDLHERVQAEREVGTRPAMVERRGATD
jgi:D-ribose pyranase